jgi:hypothetical protein
MRHRPSIAAAVGVVGLLIGALAAASQFLPLFLDGPIRGAGPGFFAVSGLLFVLNPFGLVVVGYWAGLRVDVTRQYGSLLLVLALVGGGATAVGYLVVAGLALAETGDTGAVEILFAVGYNAVVHAINIAVTCFAGAALAEFRGA